MKSTGKYSEHEELEMNPEKPFLKDLKKDLDIIDLYYNKKTAKEIKTKMSNLIIESLKMGNRQKALRWWKSLSNDEKLINATKYKKLYGRTIQSLTGSEIEKIYRYNLLKI